MGQMVIVNSCEIFAYKEEYGFTPTPQNRILNIPKEKRDALVKVINIVNADGVLSVDKTMMIIFATKGGKISLWFTIEDSKTLGINLPFNPERAKSIKMHRLEEARLKTSPPVMSHNNEIPLYEGFSARESVVDISSTWAALF